MAGFIHGKLDIKLLILFLASRLAAPVNQPTLTELCLCDDGVNYFQLAQCLAELVASGHLSLEGDLYAITDKGRRNLAASESSLSPVIRARCAQRLAPLNSILRQEAQVLAQVVPHPAGGYLVRLSLSDERDTLLSLELLAPSEETGQQIAEHFRAHPESVYNGVLGTLLPRG